MLYLHKLILDIALQNESLHFIFYFSFVQPFAYFLFYVPQKSNIFLINFNECILLDLSGLFRGI